MGEGYSRVCHITKSTSEYRGVSEFDRQLVVLVGNRINSFSVTIDASREAGVAEFVCYK